MKLREFNAENTISMRTEKATVHINIKTGLLNFNQPACTLIGVAGGDRIVFLQDEEEPESWYLEVVKEKGFILREKANVTKGVLLNNSAIARAIAESTSFTGTSGRVLISSDIQVVGKRKLWVLITASLKAVIED